MYLKSLELVGFKSFADRTKLEFEPGMTAIVGPNGCGKSNISDSVRWVLGEQSAKALRGSKMEDVIFNGTELHKPLGMAEVSITLADCEQTLGTEYNEVTITRRVFRSGEGQYFINKTPCRLKDIQRLFMDTGVGTNSYSLMEQGRIDLILSSRPEDRREVFEEASGITKFKADKKEAIRKLEHTETNLLRLADIVREVRRQIISLQRQAGKARRYKELQEQLRGLDIFATRDRLTSLNEEISTLESRLASITEQEEAVRADLEQNDQQASTIRADLASTEKQIAEAMEASVQSRTELDRARELIRINQDRIQELKDLSERDSRDANEARNRLEQHRGSLKEHRAELDQAVAARDAAEKELSIRNEALVQQDAELEQLRKLVHELGAESVDLESRIARLQNELHTLEAEERTTVIRRERLAAEHGEIQRVVQAFEGRQGDMARGLEQLQQEAKTAGERVQTMTAQRTDKVRAIAEVDKELAGLRAAAAARQAKIELLGSKDAKTEGFPGGARLLLDEPGVLGINPSLILGSLAERLQAEPPYRMALEAALRAWLDAIVVSDDAFAIDILREIGRRGEGSLRALSVKTQTAPAPFFNGPGERLLDHVQCAGEIRPLAERVLHNVRVVSDVGDIPTPLLPEATYVTQTGALLRGNGSFEYWLPESHEINPLAREHQLAEWERELADIRQKMDQAEANLKLLKTDEQSFDAGLEAARHEFDEARKRLSQREGENHIISQEAGQAREKSDTVAWELKQLTEQHSSGEGRRSAIHQQIEDMRNRMAQVRSTIATKTDDLRSREQDRQVSAAEVTDYRVRFAERRQQAEHLTARIEPMQARIAELEGLIQNRSQDINSYQSRIQDLQTAITTTEARLQPMQDNVNRLGEQLEAARHARAEKLQVLAAADSVLREKRAAMDDIRNRKSSIDVEVAEQRVRRQNLVERISADYHITPDQMLAEPEPVWEDGHQPDREQLETNIAEIRAKLEAMGPVNLVAIEEHRELEERFTFLSQQQDDLVKAKQQLMDMIRRINKTTTEMFSKTFEQVNANFQEMFKRIFGGGSAKLVLVNEEDVLESGIEIIARPPGKKLQTVSLLSGGERTMTAVALLFSLYMVKPSPFCLLDELDAALDESNIGRFVKVVQGFLDRSQFVVITHNRQTISAASVLYGVTMEQSGVSKIVSVKFSRHERKKDEPEPAGSASAEPVTASVTEQTTSTEPAPTDTPEPPAAT
ncbi:MAG TPA: chromosome segregation protein SMC [Kiritimatiellia bacterium]|nr:chromosome segregation protein SMC [Kiritimatiellia bacterium]